MHNKKLSLGQIIAHSVPLSSLESICSSMGRLIDRDFFEELKRAHSIWEVRVQKKDPIPLIQNPELTFQHLRTLFETRHVIVHEMPKSSRTPFSDIPTARQFIGESLTAATVFLQASNEAISRILNPDPPLTQAEITSAAGKLYEAEEASLSEVLSRLDFVIEWEGDSARLEKFRKGQALWEEFRAVQAEFEADECKGGTIWGTLYCMAARGITEERRHQLSRLLRFADETDRLGDGE